MTSRHDMPLIPHDKLQQISCTENSFHSPSNLTDKQSFDTRDKTGIAEEKHSHKEDRKNIFNSNPVTIYRSVLRILDSSDDDDGELKKGGILSRFLSPIQG
jgi:hypothetical protein